MFEVIIFSVYLKHDVVSFVWASFEGFGVGEFRHPCYFVHAYVELCFCAEKKKKKKQ